MRLRYRRQAPTLGQWGPPGLPVAGSATVILLWSDQRLPFVHKIIQIGYYVFEKSSGQTHKKKQTEEPNLFLQPAGITSFYRRSRHSSEKTDLI